MLVSSCGLHVFRVFLPTSAFVCSEYFLLLVSMALELLLSIDFTHNYFLFINLHFVHFVVSRIFLSVLLGFRYLLCSYSCFASQCSFYSYFAASCPSYNIMQYLILLSLGYAATVFVYNNRLIFVLLAAGAILHVPFDFVTVISRVAAASISVYLDLAFLFSCFCRIVHVRPISVALICDRFACR